jgi:hypothetical protein
MAVALWLQSAAAMPDPTTRSSKPVTRPVRPEAQIGPMRERLRLSTSITAPKRVLPTPECTRGESLAGSPCVSRELPSTVQP